MAMIRAPSGIFFAGEFFGVAGAVEIFVMVADHFADAIHGF